MAEEIVHADIFFFITSIAVAICAIGSAAAFYYIIRILRDAQALMAKARKAGDEIEKDFEEARAAVRAEGARARSAFALILGFISRRLQSRERKKRSAGAGVSEEEVV